MQERPLFERIRIQMLFPCRAKCKWCNTFPKNPQFAQLWRDGLTEEVNNFYLQVLKRYQPKNLYISGGEAILMPSIGEFLRRALKHCNKIYLFTSFQYPKHILENLDLSGIPDEQLILTHSCIHFIPEKWHDLTNGFPHELYTTNLLLARELRFKKRVKFVINHPDSAEEIKLFVQTIKPNETFDLSYKLINDQNNGFGLKVMQETKEKIRQILEDYNLPLIPPDTNISEGVVKDDILSFCKYRYSPIEMRFAFWKILDEGVCLKVRFCPYFGPSTYHKFIVGSDPLKKLDKWFNSGEYLEKCDSCRLLYYGNASSEEGVLV